MTDKTTEEKIIAAAEEVFTEKGMAGARMQEIADRAGINKALLHYYYRSKEKLFGVIFKMAIQVFAPSLIKVFETPGDIFQKIEIFVKSYLDLLERNPHLPGFVISELSNNPKRLIDLLSTLNLDVQPIFDQIEEAVEQKLIRPVKPDQLIINVLSLCIFPLVARPMIQTIVYKGSENDFRAMLEQRKDEVVHFVISSIKYTE